MFIQDFFLAAVCYYSGTFTCYLHGEHQVTTPMEIQTEKLIKRLENFTDAALAIGMLFLIIDLKVPELINPTREVLIDGFLSTAPHFFTFIITFAMFATVWKDHHYVFSKLEGIDRMVILLNFLLMLLTSLLPFSASLAGHYSDNGFAVLVLAINISLVTLCLIGMTAYITRKKYWDADEANNLVKGGIAVKGIILGVVLFASLFLSYDHPHIGLILCSLVPLLHLINKLPAQQRKKVGAVKVIDEVSQ